MNTHAKLLLLLCLSASLSMSKSNLELMEVLRRTAEVQYQKMGAGSVLDRSRNNNFHVLRMCDNLPATPEIGNSNEKK